MKVPNTRSLLRKMIIRSKYLRNKTSVGSGYSVWYLRKGIHVAVLKFSIIVPIDKHSYCNALKVPSFFVTDQGQEIPFPVACVLILPPG